MKTFSARKRERKPLDRSAAIACAGINLLATPGLGTIMAGRVVAGAVQLTIAVAGFSLIMYFFWLWFRAALFGGERPPHVWWHIGVPVFFTAWLASGWSSFRLIRQAKPGLPPKLDER